jgi:RNA polymerase-interacting CarD/CdnL/TRCF family regulator
MARRYRGTIYTDTRVDVQIDVDDVIELISDEELLAEIKSRKLEEGAKARIKASDPFDLLAEVVDWLRAGDTREALLILERIMHPKFSSLELCEQEFAKLRVSS